MPKLTVEGVGQFDVPLGKRLVLALEQEAGIDQLHACGGHARCTTCRVEFVAGEPERMTAAERDVLSARGLSGVRLSCQIACEKDMTVRAISRLAGSGRKDVGPTPAAQFKIAPLTTRELRRAAERLPRVQLGHFPTPLEPLPRFSQAIGGPPIWIKRDDCTGLAFGGNKTRHNEFILGRAIEQGTEMVVWGAGVQSNNCRQTAAACAHLGWPIHLILSRANHGDDVQGNLLLDHLLGATVEVVDEPVGPGLFDMITAHAEKLRAQGRNVFAWDSELCKPLATVSYALCMAEVADQMEGYGLKPSALYISSAGATGSGVILGKAALGLDWHVRSIAPLQWPWDVPADLALTAMKGAELMGLPLQISVDEVDVTHEYIGPGYGIPTEAGMEATRLLARTEGILVDPIYTAKALACLIDDIRGGRLSGNDPIVFVHTGGTPALFAYRDEMMKAM